MAGALPPKLLVTPHFKQTFRFVSSSASASNITLASLLGMCGTIGTVTNSKVAAWTASLRILKVTVWPPGGSGASDVALDWANGTSDQVPDNVEDASMPSGVTVSKAFVFTPPSRSLAGFWLNNVSSAVTIFNLYYPAGAIIDVHVDIRLGVVYEPLAITVATAVVGNVYYLALDGPSSNKLVPSNSAVPTTH
jgi:hypothetical protein